MSNTIGGTIWKDTDADGTLDGGESGRFENVTVVLFDGNGNIVAITKTDASGNYSFPGLPDGAYRVDVTDANNLLNGYWHSTGSSPGSDDNSQSAPYTVAVTGGQTNTTADFGYYVDPAALGDFVWLDRDNDGVQEVDEPGIYGIAVTLTITYPNGGVSTLVTRTDRDGTYSFGNLLQDENQAVGDDTAGTPTYTISFAAPPGASASPTGQGTPATDSNGASTVANPIYQGQTDSTYDSGFYTLRLDLGDLPTTYPTIFSPGPAHIVFPDTDSDGAPDTAGGTPAVWLGLTIDIEGNGQPTSNADGDDANGDDEDGVTFPTSWQKGASATIDIALNSSQSAVTVYYGMWIDWDDDGSLDEFYTGTGITGSPVVVSVPVTMPLTYNYSDPVYFRVRAHDYPFSFNDSTGTRSNGEVEDYRREFDGPTAVTMGQYGAISGIGQVQIYWETALELDAIGFNLFRATDPDGELVQINPELIPSQAFGGLMGASYEFIDRDVQTGQTYYYWLEFIDIEGKTVFGPMQAILQFGIYLPLVTR